MNPLESRRKNEALSLSPTHSVMQVRTHIRAGTIDFDPVTNSQDPDVTSFEVVRKNPKRTRRR